jgi:hypothetical protein
MGLVAGGLRNSGSMTGRRNQPRLLPRDWHPGSWDDGKFTRTPSRSAPIGDRDDHRRR